jgi:hypothetical protein
MDLQNQAPSKSVQTISQTTKKTSRLKRPLHPFFKSMGQLQPVHNYKRSWANRVIFHTQVTHLITKTTFLQQYFIVQSKVLSSSSAPPFETSQSKDDHRPPCV